MKGLQFLNSRFRTILSQIFIGCRDFGSKDDVCLGVRQKKLAFFKLKSFIHVMNIEMTESQSAAWISFIFVSDVDCQSFRIEKCTLIIANGAVDFRFCEIAANSEWLEKE